MIDEKEIICPHCGKIQSIIINAILEDTEIICWECSKPFKYLGEFVDDKYRG